MQKEQKLCFMQVIEKRGKQNTLTKEKKIVDVNKTFL